MWMNLGDYQGVLNCPSDNGRFDHEGERGVSNAVLINKNAELRIKNGY